MPAPDTAGTAAKAETRIASVEVRLDPEVPPTKVDVEPGLADDATIQSARKPAIAPIDSPAEEIAAKAGQRPATIIEDVGQDAASVSKLQDAPPAPRNVAPDFAPSSVSGQKPVKASVGDRAPPGPITAKRPAVAERPSASSTGDAAAKRATPEDGLSSNAAKLQPSEVELARIQRQATSTPAEIGQPPLQKRTEINPSETIRLRGETALPEGYRELGSIGAAGNEAGGLPAGYRRVVAKNVDAAKDAELDIEIIGPDGSVYKQTGFVDAKGRPIYANNKQYFTLEGKRTRIKAEEFKDLPANQPVREIAELEGKRGAAGGEGAGDYIPSAEPPPFLLARRPGHTYAARRQDLATSKGEMTTVEAFKTGKGSYTKPENWLPVRGEWQKTVVAQEIRAAQKFAAHQTGEPAIHAMRGNTGAGKTRATKNHPDLQENLPVVNADLFKQKIIAHGAEEGVPLVNPKFWRRNPDSSYISM